MKQGRGKRGERVINGLNEGLSECGDGGLRQRLSGRDTACVHLRAKENVSHLQRTSKQPMLNISIKMGYAKFSEPH